MAKDPAMLWYWSDWNSGTTTLSRFLKGCYIDLLHAQFNSGHLSLDEIKTVLGSDFGQAWPTIQKKFSTDPRGLFFNERLELEKQKRKEYTESRAKNRTKKDINNISKTHQETYVTHMDNVNENENIIEIGLKKEYHISIKKVYANDKVKIIYDLEKYFNPSLEQFTKSGWTRFDEFLKSNPGRVFDDEDHLYNAFKKYHEGSKSTHGRKLTYEELSQ